MGLVGLFGLLPRCFETRFEFSGVWLRAWGVWVCMDCFRAALTCDLNFQVCGVGDGACGFFWFASALF